MLSKKSIHFFSQEKQRIYCLKSETSYKKGKPVSNWRNYFIV